ncbi:putative Senescence-related protein 1 [Hibiscus syriacus]|uniref:Senescence-related protein 1 n=1 Tax=Hibiscus syriacus TaxID=106335 RepID=A0A6A3AS18_HIBSY|nr:putative Senescence-related protein 1 [Hibiscus syriacus]
MATKSELAKLGASLLVPSVQELAKEPLTKLPPRYVRTDEDPPVASHTNLLPQVPVIDMQKLSSQEERDLLHHACKDWGFFQLINHGVSTSLLEKMKMEVQQFFNLPMEEKKKLWQRPDEIEGFGQAFVVSEEQKLNWGDMFYMITLPTYLRKPHLFPNLPLTLRFFLSASLNHFTVKYTIPNEIPELAIGLSAHSDPVGLTILLQISEMEGLQVKKDGGWVPIKPLENAFIVNIGDIMEVMISNACSISL